MIEWFQYESKADSYCFNITVIQVYATTTNAEETDIDQFYEDLQHLLELTPKKDVLIYYLFIYLAYMPPILPEGLWAAYNI